MSLVTSNQIYVVKCYKHHGLWVFDDPAKGIVKEALVGGTDLAIDILTEDVPYAKHGFVLSFSEKHFAGSKLSASFTSIDKESGYWYQVDLPGTTLPMWLCEVLMMYYLIPPAQLFAGAWPITPNKWQRIWYKLKDMFVVEA